MLQMVFTCLSTYVCMFRPTRRILLAEESVASIRLLNSITFETASLFQAAEILYFGHYCLFPLPFVIFQDVPSRGVRKMSPAFWSWSL
jgi:hypothetical protein